MENGCPVYPTSKRGGRISRMNRCNLTNEQDPMLAWYENKT